MNNSKLTAISLSTIILLGYTQPVQALNTTSEATVSSGSITENLNDKGKIMSQRILQLLHNSKSLKIIGMDTKLHYFHAIMVWSQWGCMEII